MERKHRDWILAHYADLVAGKPIVALLIPDDYGYMDDELVDILTNRVAAYLAGD